ncbi:MAG: folylpolyglutamate synthase/dihydrofolate synthase family protein [Spirulinaceae cyanobacterium]
MTIDSLLQSFQRFGVHLGLERIEQLLAKLGNPHRNVPIIHVAGTNGKGSVCAYLSSVLTAAGYCVGRYTSPHLVDWTERICLNEQPITSETLQELLLKIQGAIEPNQESPTQFEVITAAAWLCFAQSQVDIAVIEAGLGGRLDATNVCDTPLVSVITSLSREHWQRLGPELADIAREKAGILKPGCPGVIGVLPTEATEVVARRIKELNCPAVWIQPAQEVTLENGIRGASYEGINYPLPLEGEIQLTNSAIAIATLKILQSKGWQIPLTAIQAGMAKTTWAGRLQWLNWGERNILVDGAHNTAAAKSLRQYVDGLEVEITWVMGMLSTKDHQDIFQVLLRPGEQLYLVPVPEHSSANPQALASLAKEVCPELTDCQTFSNLPAALEQALLTSNNPKRLIVLCGSLYLVGNFLSSIGN